MSKAYKAALKECKRVGTAHATGDALRAMYAGLVCLPHFGKPHEPKVFAHLQAFTSDESIAAEARSLMRDHAKLCAVIFD